MKIITIDPNDFIILSALRGPDDPNTLVEKLTGAAVIRYWVNGADMWGTVTALPFVIVRDDNSHYTRHVAAAADVIGLGIVTLDFNEWAQFEKEVRSRTKWSERDVVSALYHTLADPIAPNVL